MIIRIDRSGTVNGFGALLEEVAGSEDVRGVLALACHGNGFTPRDVDPLLRAVPKPVFGGVFPGVLHGRSILWDKGAVVVGLRCPLEVRLVPRLSHPLTDIEAALDDLHDDLHGKRTMLVFVDPYSSGLTALMENLFVVFGLEPNYLGGGAGPAAAPGVGEKSAPCLFTSQGMVADAVQLVGLDMASRIGVAHGMSMLEGPFTVTETRGTRIVSLDWLPAFDVYKRVVDKHSPVPVDKENFSEIVKRYPLGLGKLGAEHVIREILGEERGELILAAEVPEDCFADVMNGESEHLVLAAREAYRRARSDAGSGGGKRSTLVMDCFSRHMFLGDGFQEELDALNEDGVPLAGALTVGEIANSGEDYLEFLNKTCVTGIMED